MFARRRTDPQPRRDPIHEAIQRRAFELFLQRGARHGRDLDDWLEAERHFLHTATSTHSRRLEASPSAREEVTA